MRWGPLLRIVRGYAAEQDIRFRGATGGVLTALAIYLFREQTGRFYFCMWRLMRRVRCARVPHLSYNRADVLKARALVMAPPPP